MLTFLLIPQYQQEMQQKVADYLLDAPFIFLPLICLKRPEAFVVDKASQHSLLSYQRAI